MKKKIMFLIALSIVSLVAFSTATYAAFEKQYNPEVTDLGFSAKTQDYMMISETGEAGTFEDRIRFDRFIEEDLLLEPLEGKINSDGIVLYRNGTVTNNNYIKFSLYFTANRDMDLYVEGSRENKIVDYVVGDEDNANQVKKLVDSLRIGFVAYDSEIIEGDTYYTPVKTNIYSVNEKGEESYRFHEMPYETFSTIGYYEGLAGDEILLNVKGGETAKLDIYIWIEDADLSSNAVVYDSYLEVYMRFRAVVKDVVNG